MRKANSILILLLLMVSLTYLLTGCGGEEPEDTLPSTSETTAMPLPEVTPAVETPEPELTLTDDDVEVEGEATVEADGATTPTPQDSELTAVIVSGDSAGAGKPFTFDATQSQAGTLTIEGYEWDMGDGTFLHGLTVEHAYAEPGLYTVTLTITAEGGQTDTTSKVVEVVELVEGATPTVVGQFALAGTSWEMNNPMRGTTITLEFGAEIVSGSSGCNSYNARYTTATAGGPTTSISVGTISVTNQKCTPEIMAQEQGYLDNLESASSYAIDGATLILETGSGTLTFSLVEAVE